MSTQTSVNPYFSPTQLSGCALWFDAADSTMFLPANPLSGTSIQQWRDKINNVTLSNENASPTWTSNGVLFTNPTSVVSGTTQNLNYVGSTPIVLTQNYSLFVAHAPNSFDNYRVAFTLYAPRAFNVNPSFAAWVQTSVNEGNSIGVFDGSSSWRSLQQWNYVNTGAGNRRIDSLLASPTNIARTNGTQNTGLINNIGSGSNISGSQSLTGVGMSASSTFQGNRAYDGRIFEVLLYTSALSLINVQQIEGYLAWKWGFQGNLPATHPYKNSPIPPLLNPSRNLPFTLQNSFFTPRQISGCGLWLDGADPNGNNVIPSGGMSLSTWFDKSGAGANGIVVGSAATYTSGGGLLFAANGAYNTSYSASLTNESLFIVFRYTKPNAQQGLVCQTGDGGRATTLLAGASTAAFESSVYNVAFGAVSPSTTVPINAIGLGELVTTNSNMAIWYNGTSFGTPTTVTITPGRTSVVGGAYNAGSPNSAQYFGGSIFEVIGYTVALSASQRQLIEGYLAWKWGFQSFLPSNHPYKSSPIPPLVNPPTTNPIIRYATWQPTQISACALWLDAADRNTITFSAGNIIQWRDKSPTNTTAITSNGVSANPILLQNGGIYINNNSSQTYNASTYSMLAVQSNIMTTSDFTIVVVVNNPTNDTSAIFSDPRASGASETRSQLNHGFLFEVSTGGSGRFTNPTTAAGTGTRILIATSVPAQSQFFNNGSLTGSNTTAITSYSTDAGGLPTLGGYRNTETGGSDNSWFTGTLFEVLFYTTALNTSQRQQVEGYLAWKWRLQGNLPANHPFAKWPPSP